MRGEVIDYTAGEGLISGEDGVRYSFRDDDIARRDGPIRAGVKVDFVPEGERATQIYRLAENPARSLESTNEDLGVWGYFKKCMRLYATRDGRARRKEYWSFILVSWLLALAGAFVLILLCAPLAANDHSSGSPASILAGILIILACLAYLIALGPPTFAVLSRRLHDIGMSGWFALFSLVPYAGGLFVLIVALIPSQEEVNRYGKYPKPRAPYPV